MWIKYLSRKSVQEIQAIRDEQLIENEKKDEFTVRDIREFTLNISRDHICTIYRCFIQADDSKDLSNVGWIINETCQFCPLCNHTFTSVFRAKHHCRRCGDIICSSCSRYGKLKGFDDLGSVIVCRGCFDQKVSNQFRF
jgi:superfamily II helicase